MLSDSGKLQDYRWECPYPDCKYSILSYTQTSFERRRTEHLEGHLKQSRQEREQREAKLAEALEPLGVSFRKNPEKLHVTWRDVEFLITRGIRIDEDIEWDGFSRKSEVPTSTS